jgi:hypothetical protein
MDRSCGGDLRSPAWHGQETVPEQPAPFARLRRATSIIQREGAGGDRDDSSAGKIFRLGKLPQNVQFAGFYNVERPAKAADWSLRFQVQLPFPR